MLHDASLTLEAKGLSVAYGRAGAQKGALLDASFQVQRGEALGVIGETGAGKSSLARAVLGLVPPARGTVDIVGQRVTSFTPQAWRSFRRTGALQYVFQDPLRSLDPDLSVADSIAEPLWIRGEHSAHEVEVRVLEQLERMRLERSLLTRFPGELSGGQRQRVAIARALIGEPKLLILDEPVSALDSANRRQVLSLLLDLRAAGTSLLFISHDLGSVAGLCDRILVLYRGSILEADTTDRIVNHPSHSYTQRLLSSAPTLASARKARSSEHWETAP